MTEQVRVLRVLEYVGTRKFVEASLAQRAVKGVTMYGLQQGVQCAIREAIVGQELGFETITVDEPDNIELSGDEHGRK